MPSQKDDNRIVVTVYPIAGKQLLFRVPDRFCRECELTHRLVQQVLEELALPEEAVRLEVKPWLNNLIEALRRGGWHPPVVTINGRVFSQGVVPDKEALREALLRAFGNTPRGAAYPLANGEEP